MRRPHAAGPVRRIGMGVALLLLAAHALAQHAAPTAAWSACSDDWPRRAGLAPETLPGWVPRGTHLDALGTDGRQQAYYWTDRLGALPPPGAGALALSLADEYGRGHCDAVIAVATRYLQSADTPDPTIRYLRGLAALRVFRLALAAADLKALDGLVPWPGWAAADQAAARVRTLQALCPPQVRELQRGGVPIFRVYYEEDNAWTRALLATLPEAYARVTGFCGREPGETPVFVFRHNLAYEAFFEAYAEEPPKRWQWAAGATGSLLFCQEDANREEAAAAGSDYFRAAIAHEFAHCLLGRYVGWGPVPAWLDEGLAQECGARLASGDYARNDAAIAEALAGTSLLALEALERSFYDEDTKHMAYAEAFAMVRHMEHRFGRGRLLRLIVALREARDPDAALRKVVGLDQQGVYDAWLQAARAQYGSAPGGQ